MERRIGIMGGTFDPPHLAHLRISEEAREAFRLEQVLFIPAADPPHKRGRPITPYHHRYRMTELAIAGNDAFSISDMEKRRKGLSYSLLTIQELAAGGDKGLYFITGMDSINELHTWYHPKELLSLCHFIGTTRPGDPVDPSALQRDFGALADNIDFLEVPGFEISSTDIRRRVREGRSIRYLVPQAVERYIREEGLYI